MGTEKRARQKVGKLQNREAKLAAEKSRKRRKIVFRILVLGIIATGLVFLIRFCTNNSESLETSSTEGEEMLEAPREKDPSEEEEEEMGLLSKKANYRPYRDDDYGNGPCAPAEGVNSPRLDFDSAPALCIDPSKSYTAVFTTTRGTVRVLLDVVNTPGTVNNFVNLARWGYYENTLIHRSDTSLGILQGGSPHTNSASDPGPGYKIWDEGTGFKYKPGQLVMARTEKPNSASAQYFFTVTERASALDNQGTYVVFGEVTEGLDVLKAILDSHVDTPESLLGGRPEPPVNIQVSIEETSN